MRLGLRASIPALLILSGFGPAFAQEPDQITTPGLSGAVPRFHGDGAWSKGHHAPSHFGPGVAGIDSVVNFTGSFTAAGFDPNGNPQSVWPFSMVGNDPATSRTTTIDSSLIPVSLLLLDENGNPRYVNGQLLFSDATQFVRPVLKSPVFDFYRYSSSGEPTQYVDAIQKAEYFNQASNDWHTLLAPSVKTPRLMTLIQGTYRFALNTDGSCCAYILVDEDIFGNAVFPPPTYPVDGTTILGAAELAGDATTQGLTTLLFNNVFLYANNDPTQCCVLGYHTYDLEPGLSVTSNPRLYVMNYASWITPGLFAGIADITGLSHEMTETYNDPFLNNITPWWLAPNGNCQDDLEGGDVIEGLTNDVYPITMNGYTYHPQNIALLPWFEFQSPSKAIHHAYSYPDTTVITSLSAPQKASCAN